MYKRQTEDGASHDLADVWFTRDNTGGTASAAPAGSPVADETTTQVAQAGAASGTDAQAGADPATSPTLGVTTSDLLADRGEDLLGGAPPDNAAPDVQITTALVQSDVQLIPIDRSNLIDEQQNHPLI